MWADFGVAVETSALGCELVFPENAAPGVKQTPVKKPEDIENLEVPDPKKDGLMPLALETIEYMKRNVPTDLMSAYGYLEGFGISIGPTDLAGLVIGYDRFIVWQLNYPDLIHKAMRIATETVISYIQAQLETSGGANLVIVADDATGFLNRASFERFSFPYVQEVLRKFYRRDKMVLFHSDSDNMAIVDKIKEWPFHIYNYGPRMDAEILKGKLAGRIALIGGLAPLGPLRYGKTEEVDRACKEAMQKGAKGGGFVLSTCGGTAAGTPEEKHQDNAGSGQEVREREHESMNQQFLEQISEAMAMVDSEKVKDLVERAIQDKVSASDIVSKGLPKGLEIVGQKYEPMEYFLTELIMAGEIMKNMANLLKPYLEKDPMEIMAVCAIGTVRGDIHDLGKNIVITMLQGAGFQIHDLGVDVPTELFVQEVKELRPKLLGLSAMLLSTAPAIGEVVDALKKQGIRERVKVIVGGRPLNKDIAKEYGADGYAKDAVEAVQVAKQLANK